jgi:hypothetical protein
VKSRLRVQAVARQAGRPKAGRVLVGPRAGDPAAPLAWLHSAPRRSARSAARGRHELASSASNTRPAKSGAGDGASHQRPPAGTRPGSRPRHRGARHDAAARAGEDQAQDQVQHRQHAQAPAREQAAAVGNQRLQSAGPSHQVDAQFRDWASAAVSGATPTTVSWSAKQGVSEPGPGRRTGRQGEKIYNGTERG